MARKAVQGYTEKSYYDNTRFLGVVATTDPLNEGYFKHLVNLDISDTGQSVIPRKGYLSTTIKDVNGFIPLSENTIIFKDNNVSEHIIYDFTSGKGFIADVSAYNIENKMLPITHEITKFDWTDFLTLLINESTYVAEYAEAADISATLSHVLEHLTVNKEVPVKHVFDEYGIQKVLLQASLKFDEETQLNLFVEVFYRKLTHILNLFICQRVNQSISNNSFIWSATR